MTTPLENQPLAQAAYDALAERYARLIDTKPHNAFYERPAMLALLGEVRGLRVLDAGCGTGVYAEWLLDHGAEVVGVDVNESMLAFARERVGGRAALHLGDLRAPLPFLAGESFDVVLCSLVLHYVAEWAAPLATFARVLRPGGALVLSTGHPLVEPPAEDGDYFAVELSGETWRGFGGEPVYVPFYRRPLGAITGPLADAGFLIERLVEPMPTEPFRQADPKDYAELLRRPGFICIRARKP